MIIIINKEDSDNFSSILSKKILIIFLQFYHYKNKMLTKTNCIPYQFFKISMNRKMIIICQWYWPLPQLNNFKSPSPKMLTKTNCIPYQFFKISMNIKMIIICQWYWPLPWLNNFKSPSPSPLGIYPWNCFLFGIVGFHETNSLWHLSKTSRPTCY
jgi:hypothetical protein